MRTRSYIRHRAAHATTSTDMISLMSKSVLKTYLENPDDYDLSKVVLLENGRYQGKITGKVLEATRKE